MPRLRLILLLGGAGLLLACTGPLIADAESLEDPEAHSAAAPNMHSAPDQPPPEQPPPESDPESLPSSKRLTYQSTACYGTCPIYEVTLHDNGSVEWKGERFVEIVGRATAQIDPVDADHFFEQLDAVDLDAIPTDYNFRDSSKSGCAEIWTDHPSVVMTLWVDDKPRTIDDYHGCKGNPALDQLRVLEDQFQALVDVDRFIGRFPSCMSYPSGESWLLPRDDGTPHDTLPVQQVMAHDPSSRVRVRAHASRDEATGASRARAEAYVAEFIRQGGDNSRIEILDLGDSFARYEPDSANVKHDRGLELEIVSDDCLRGLREHFGGPRVSPSQTTQ